MTIQPSQAPSSDHHSHSRNRLNQAIAVPALDWNQLWKDAYLQRKKHKNQKQYWNGRAHTFARHADRSPYVDDFINRLAPAPSWSILDVGCGAGTLALPLAPLVRTITAIDFSETMLALLHEQCLEKEITNIHPRNIAWEEDWDAAGIEPHDVVIASRSLVPYDLQTAIEKLNGKALRRVIITTIVGDGPFDPRIFAAVGRSIEPRPDYIYVLNLLYQMQIKAEVSFIVNSGDDRAYANLDDAVTSVRWMIPDMTAREELLLADFFRQNLTPTATGFKIQEPHTIRWAYISWDKQ